MAVLFFSYSHKDEALRDKLEVHLAMLRRQGVIETWHDRRIVAGDEFHDRIGEELERADIILLLVSPDFISPANIDEASWPLAMIEQVAGDVRYWQISLQKSPRGEQS